MYVLDTRTVLFSYLVSNVICALIMLFLWLQNRRRFPETGFWLADYGMQLTAILLLAFRGTIAEQFSVLLGTPLAIGGTILLYIGLKRFFKATGTEWYLGLFFAMFVAFHEYFAFLHPSMQMRNIAFSTALALICLRSGWLLLNQTRREKRASTLLVGVVFLLFTVFSLARILMDLLVVPAQDLFKANIMDTSIFLIYQMLFISLTFTLLLVVNRRLLNELETDIAKRIRTEEALRKSEEKFAIAFKNIPDALTITSLQDGKIMDVNNSFFQLSGYTPEEITGKTTIDLNLWETIGAREKFVAELEKKGRVLYREAQFRRKTGELFTGLISSEVISIRNTQCVLTVIQDISTRKQAELEREQIIRQLQDALDQVKTLRGFIPICANCKKIRDDKGYWNEVEKYVTEHSDAQFSHGMCPDCLQKLYPDFVTIKNEKSSEKSAQ